MICHEVGLERPQVIVLTVSLPGRGWPSTTMFAIVNATLAPGARLISAVGKSPQLGTSSKYCDTRAGGGDCKIGERRRGEQLSHPQTSAAGAGEHRLSASPKPEGPGGKRHRSAGGVGHHKAQRVLLIRTDKDRRARKGTSRRRPMHRLVQRVARRASRSARPSRAHCSQRYPRPCSAACSSFQLCRPHPHPSLTDCWYWTSVRPY